MRDKGRKYPVLRGTEQWKIDESKEFLKTKCGQKQEGKLKREREKLPLATKSPTSQTGVLGFRWVLVPVRAHAPWRGSTQDYSRSGLLTPDLVELD